MPSSTQPEQATQKEAKQEDRVSEAVKLYPVFCTAEILSKMLDEFIDQAYEGCFAMVDDGDVGAAPCILQTTDLSSITHGSRKPMPDFESPFLGKTVDEIRTWMKEHKNPNFAQATFTILDEDTLKNKTCRVGSTLGEERLLITDFYATMYWRVPIEMATISWEEEEFVGTQKVYNRTYIENGLKE